ncbi:hypothetical protein GCM10023231_07760 [Olivibacter ginsenosidimutans]|uniref:TonB C-terminal domain-containing protein n=1 Tax=Olivibacter ginsenosidimutans TaxID=1176537 RepID=A0ABP9AKM1_9SPHI
MNYLIISNIYLVLFYAFYRLFLARETFFQLNRIYLVGTAFLSFVLPLVQLEWLQHAFKSSSVFVARTSLDAVTVYTHPQETAEIHAVGVGLPWWLYVYIGGCFLQLLFLIYRYWMIKRRLKENNLGDAYSFLGTIKVDDRQEGSDRVFEHEQVHVKQRHSIDILFVALIQLFNWFNPVVYWFVKSIRLVHEYIADEAVNKSHTDKIAYAELLIGRTFAISPSALANNFFNQSTVKNRIVMLFRDKSGRPALFKYLLAMPLFIAMLVFSSAKVSDGAEDLTGLTLRVQDNESFYKLIAQQVRYSQEAKEQKVQGVVDVSFEKQEGEVKTKVLYTMGYNQEKELVRALQLPEVIKEMPAGKNVLRVKFLLSGVEPAKLNEPLVIPRGYRRLEEVVIMGYYPEAKREKVKQTIGSKASQTTTREKQNATVSNQNKADSEKLGMNLTLSAANVEAIREEDPEKPRDFNEVEVQPSFQGGMRAFYQWVSTHYKYPKEAVKQGVSGALHLSFIVNEDGSLSDIRLLRDLGYGTGEEAIRMLKECPKWLPGIINGKAVKVAYSLPIKLNLRGMDEGQKTKTDATNTTS